MRPDKSREGRRERYVERGIGKIKRVSLEIDG